MRGGTGVISDNILPAISSCAWGNKGNVLFSVLNIARVTPAVIHAGRSYPASVRGQTGLGEGAVFHYLVLPAVFRGRQSYYTYEEPVYIWNNSGTGGNQLGLNAESADPCGNNQLLTNYIQAGRDYRLGPKPGLREIYLPASAENRVNSVSADINRYIEHYCGSPQQAQEVLEKDKSDRK